jgi:hypothetical protein
MHQRSLLISPRWLHCCKPCYDGGKGRYLATMRDRGEGFRGGVPGWTVIMSDTADS